MNNFEFKPRSGGLEKLRMRLDAYERQERFERKIFGGAAVVLILALVCAIPWSSKSPTFPEDAKGAIQVEGADIHEVRVSNDGVRLYWILQ